MTAEIEPDERELSGLAVLRKEYDEMVADYIERYRDDPMKVPTIRPTFDQACSLFDDWLKMKKMKEH